MKHSIQAALRLLGYRLERIREPVPFAEQIDIFSFCMNDLIFRRSKRPSVLQIGANDGIRADPVFKFITEKELDAVLVEPVPSTFAQLKMNYAKFPNAKLVMAAIAESTGSMSLYVPSRSLLTETPKLSGLCSFKREILIGELQREGYRHPEGEVREIVVPTFSVDDFIKAQGIDTIDVLQIDTEGYDWRILSQFDLDDLRVSLINMEFFHLEFEEKRHCIDHFASHGFKIAFTLGDIIAYR